MGTNESNKPKGEEINVESLSRFPFRVRVSAYNFEHQENHPGAILTLKEVGTIIPSSSCLPGYDGIDLSGGSKTDSGGKMTWRMSDFVCADRPHLLDLPVSFVATLATHLLI